MLKKNTRGLQIRGFEGVGGWSVREGGLTEVRDLRGGREGCDDTGGTGEVIDEGDGGADGEEEGGEHEPEVQPLEHRQGAQAVEGGGLERGSEGGRGGARGDPAKAFRTSGEQKYCWLGKLPKYISAHIDCFNHPSIQCRPMERKVGS